MWCLAGGGIAGCWKYVKVLEDWLVEVIMSKDKRHVKTIKQ